MSIADKQNTPENLRLLAAQRQLYSEAKRLHLIRTIGAIGLAAVAPCALLLWPDSKVWMAVASGVWVLVSRLVLEDLESGKTKQAAKIQEQFDTGLFDLPWNGIIAGEKPSPEVIHSAARAFRGAPMKDWYAKMDCAAYPLDVLLCQRANLTWDWRLRRSYAWIVGTLAAALFVGEIVLACVTNQTLPAYLLALFLPSLSAYLQAIEIIKKHLRSAAKKETLAREVLTLWELGAKSPESVSVAQCRSIQDQIYILRETDALVPDLVYKWLRAKYDRDMRDAVAELEARIGH